MFCCAGLHVYVSKDIFCNACMFMLHVLLLFVRVQHSSVFALHSSNLRGGALYRNLKEVVSNNENSKMTGRPCKNVYEMKCFIAASHLVV